MAENIDAERAAFETWARDTDQGYASFKGTCEPGGWYYFEDDAQAAWAAWQAGRRTPYTSIGEDGLPELPSDKLATTYTGDEMRKYARDALAADRRARADLAQGAQSVKRPGAWKFLQEDDKPDSTRLLDVILLNGVCLMDRRYEKIDWTQVADWRYAAPSLSSEPQLANLDNRGDDLAKSASQVSTPLSSEQQAEKGDNACGS